jgi:hypothetical protein
MPSVAELEALRDDLIRARARGTRELQMGQERIRYGTDAEMAAAIADLEARIARASSTRPHTVAFSARKGT